MMRTALASLLLIAAAPAVAAELRCPPTLDVLSQPESLPGWAPYPAKDSHTLAGLSLIEGDRAKEMAASAPATLAPDRTARHSRSMTQSWDFIGQRKANLFLVCRYAGTQATLAIDLPRDVRRCEFSFPIDVHGAMQADSRTPPQVLCR